MTNLFKSNLERQRERKRQSERVRHREREREREREKNCSQFQYNLIVKEKIQVCISSTTLETRKQ